MYIVMNMELISLLLNLVLGGGFFISLLTIRAQRKKANAEAKGADANAESTELDNVSKAISIWRESAQASENRYKELLENYISIASKMTGMECKMTELETTVKKLTATNNLILKILKEINHDNLEQKKQEAKDIAGA